MFVSEISNYNSTKVNFAARPVNVIKAVHSKEAIVQLKGDVPSQVVTLVNVVNKLYGSLKKLEVQKSNEKAQSCLEALRTQHGFRGILETPADGIVLAGKEGKNLIVSSHGVNSLRLREQNARTGEIESSIYIHDRKVAKTDTKQEIPQKLEYLRHEDINFQFGTELQTTLDSADYALLQVRRAISAPEFQAEISKVGFAQVQPVNIKPKAAETVQKPVVEQPAAVVVKPVVKDDIRAERISLINSLLSDEPKKTADAVVEAAPVKRRGRPKGSGRKTEQESNVQATNNRHKPHTSSKRILSDDEMALVGDVKSAFRQVYSTLYSEPLSVNTRSLIKNGYGEKLGKGKAGTKILNFIGIGKDGADVGVNVVNFQQWELLHLRLTNNSGKVQDVIVNTQGKVTRSSGAIKDSAATRSVAENKVYTRQEIEDMEIVSILKRLKTELGDYNTYLENRISHSQEWKVSHAKGGQG